MTSWKIWFNATRPKTLPASLSPVIIGSTIAFYHNSFNFFYFLLISLLAVLIQISTNFINELYDFKKGADTTNRLGPTRAVAAGLIDYKSMKFVSIALVIVIFALGMILVWKSGWIIFVIGVLSLFFAWAYTGGPYPLAYNGWAEPAVLVFFGIFAVNGTYYVFTNQLDIIPLIASLMPGLLSTNLLLINNIRDIETDKLVNKNTLAVKLGRKNANHLYLVIHFLTLLVPFYLSYYLNNYLLLIPLVLLTMHIKCVKNAYFLNGRDLNNVLFLNGILILLNGALTSLSFYLLKQYG